MLRACARRRRRGGGSGGRCGRRGLPIGGLPVGIEEGVALAFEGGLAGGLPDEEAGALEPAAEILLFGLALGVGEAGDGGYPCWTRAE